MKKILIVLISCFAVVATPFCVHAQTPTGEASFIFSPELVNSKIGETFTTEIEVDTAGAAVGGVGAKITFDPKMVNVEQIETFPVFPDYPAKVFDNSTGNLTISGIVTSKEELYTGKAVFAKVSWKVVGAGTSKIEFNFVPNDTKDSNIAVLYGNGDILQKVNSVLVTVEGVPTATAVPNPDLTPVVPLPTQNPDNTPSPPVLISDLPPWLQLTVQKLLTLSLGASGIGNIVLIIKMISLKKSLKICQTSLAAPLPQTPPMVPPQVPPIPPQPNPPPRT